MTNLGSDDDSLLLDATRVLTSGPHLSFRDWPPTDLAIGPPGVYAIWKDADFLYVGISYVDRRTSSNKQAKGVFGRLASHASGRRSGDQFNIYICDRFVVPTLTSDDLDALSVGARILDAQTCAFIQEHLSYRVARSKGRRCVTDREHHPSRRAAQ